MRSISFLCLCVLASATPALAQPAIGERPFRGLFGSARGPVASQTLDFTASVTEAYDDDVLADTGTTFEPVGEERVSGFFTSLAPSLRYQALGRTAQFNVNVASAFAHYPHLSGLRSISHSGAVGTAFQLGRTRLMFNQTMAYSPSYLYDLFPSVAEPAPGLAVPVGPDYDVGDSRSLSYATLVNASRPVGRRGTLSASANYSFADFQGVAALRRPDVRAFGMGLSFARHVSRNTSLRLGYSYRGGDVGGDGIASKTVAHGLEVGTAISRPLSATRRATFGFTLGSSAVSAVEQTGVAGQDQRYRAHGNASFGYQFNTRWQARASYQRDLQYVPELSDPVFTDGFTVAVQALLSDRTDLMGTVSYSNASSALGSAQDAATVDTYTGDVRFRYALTRTWALYVSYLYYYYELTARTPSSAIVPPGLERSGVRVGLSLWLPLLRR
jgi:hypothetical protein